MRRGWSVLVSCAILAAAGYLVWRLAFQPPENRRHPVPEVPGAAVEETRPDESRPVARRGQDSAPVADDRPSSDDRISGVIYDESSNPVPEALVQIISFTYVSTSTRPLDRRFEDRVHASTITGDDGKFTFAGQVPGEVKILRVSKAGFVTQMKDGVRVPSNRNFQLVPGAVVTGVIVNAATGAPIEGVGIKGFFPATAQPILATDKAFRWKEEVFTNAKGEFAFEGAPDGIVKFMLTHPAYEDVVDDLRVRLATKNVFAFKMKPALVIEGVVLHAKKGTPVADLDVVAFDFIPLAIAPRWKARTDKDGRFKIAGVKSGTVRFEVSGRGFNPVAEARELTPAEDCTGGRPCRKLEFQVNPAGRIAGRITTPSGEPVARARIYVAPVRGIFTMVRDPAQHGGSMAEGESRSDERGSFLIDDITPGPHRLVVEAPGFALTASEGMEVAPDEIREHVDFTLRPATAIQGSVTDEVRVPVANAQVTIEVPAFGQVAFGPAFGLGQADRRTAVTDDLGRYRIDAPYAGKFPISVDHPDFALVDGGEITAEEAQPEVVRDFTLKRALAISGTVFGPSGQGEPGAVVQAWSEATGAAAGETRTGAGGAYSLNRLEAGLYRVGARKAESGLTSAFRNEIQSGSAAVDFTLTKRGEIVGAVTDSSGGPVMSYRISLRPQGGRLGPPGRERKHITAGLEEREVVTKNPEGRFRITEVDPGEWLLQITSPEHAPSALVPVAVTGAETTNVGTVVLAAGGSVSGKISMSDGAPAAGVTVTLSRIGKLPDRDEPAPIPTSPWSAVTGPGGEYSVRGLLPGEFTLRVSSPRFVAPEDERIVVRDGEVVERSLTLRAAATVTVVVKDEVGEPVPTALLRVTDEQQRPVRFDADQVAAGGTTDAAGRAELRKLPAGEKLAFRAVRMGFYGPDVSKTLREGDNGVLVIKVERAH